MKDLVALNREQNLSKFRRGLCRCCMEKRLPGKQRCEKHLEMERVRLRGYRLRVKTGGVIAKTPLKRESKN